MRGVRCAKTCLVDVLVGTRGTEAVETELLVAVALPTHGAHGLNRQDRDTVGQDRQAVLLGLSVEDLEAGNRDDAGLDALLLELLGSIDTDGHLGTGRDKGDVGTLDLLEDVGTLGGLLDGGTFELGKALARQGNNAGSVLRGQGNVVSGAGLVSVGRAPDHAVGQGAEVSQRLNRLVGRAVLTQTNGVVGSNPDGADLREGRQTDGTSAIGDEVEEGTGVRQDGAVGGETVHDGTHGVLTDTIADIAAGVVTEAVGLWLEVNSVLPAGKVGTSQVGRATKELGDSSLNLGQDSLRELAGGNGRVSGGVDGQVLLPALRKDTLLAADEVGVLLGELLAVLGEELVPLLLKSSALRGVLAVHVVDLLGDGKGLVGVEAKLLLDLLDVVRLEGSTVDATSALVEGAVANGGAELDHGGLVLDILALLNGSLDAGQVVVTVVDGDDVPAVGLIALDNILSEGAVDVTVNGDVVVIVDADEVAKLEVAGEGRGLAGDTLHQAAVAEEAVCVVVDNVESGLVENSAGVSLGHGETNGVADTLAEGASGDLNAGSVVRLGVARGDAVQCLKRGVSI